MTEKGTKPDQDLSCRQSMQKLLMTLLCTPPQQPLPDCQLPLQPLFARLARAHILPPVHAQSQSSHDWYSPCWESAHQDTLIGPRILGRS